MRLLLVFTGGTIGSSISEGYIRSDKTKPYRLLKEYKERFGIDFSYDMIEPFRILSENSNGKSISSLMKCLKERINGGYDGVLIMHGTDTLQYTAAASGYCFGNDSIPICLVSSDHPIEDDRANGLINMKGAVEFIRQKTDKDTGSFVVYKNSSERDITVHRATRVLPFQAFSADLFSRRGSAYGYLDDNTVLHRNPDHAERPDETATFSGTALSDICDMIHRIVPYPGMDYPKVDEKVRYIIHESFHSGTIDTLSSALRSFCKEMKSRDIKIYLTGMSEGISYESTESYAELGIEPLFDINSTALYMKLWLSGSEGKNADDIIRRSLGGDIG